MRRLALVVAVFGCWPVAARADLPPFFEDTPVANVAFPTALAFTPDGRLLVTSQQGRLYLHDLAGAGTTLALDLGSRVCSDHERGLLGVAVDPLFAASRSIYLFYTFDKFGGCQRNGDEGPVNRVARFTLPPGGRINPASEVVIVDNIPSPNGTHNAGDLEFGPDGHLYISVGDGGCDYSGDSGCGGANDTARGLNVLLGKILRVTRGGGVPLDNPFTGPGTTRCGLTGRAAPGLVCQEIFASGLRNPFRIAFERTATAPRFFINDVGQNTWEEVNLGAPGADYGWNVREGACRGGSSTDCPPPPPGMTDPLFAYNHTTGCTSITGGAFVPQGVWPDAFAGAYLFSDFVCGAILLLTKDDLGEYHPAVFAGHLGELSAVDLVFGPHGSTQALYYLTFAEGGQVRRIAHTPNASPTATLAAAPTFGALPLTVAFDASASSDPDGDPLTYEWVFGDGSPAQPGPTAVHTYTTAGAYTARVTVRDGHGNAAVADVRIDAGNTPPVPVILSPAAGAGFAVGEALTLSGIAFDAEDRLLPATRLSWTVLLHHNTHAHPFLPPTTGTGITFEAPAPEDLDAAASSFLEIVLTATDSGGARSTQRLLIQPRRIQVTLDSEPRGMTVLVNQKAVTTPAVLTSWEKYELTIQATTQAGADQQPWLFERWSDGGASAHTAAPGADATYTAFFDAATYVPAAGDAFVRDGGFAEVNYGAAPLLVANTSWDADERFETFLTFEVSTLPAAERTVLRLFAAMTDARSQAVPVRVFGVSAAWDEAAVTWATRPSSEGETVATALILGEIPQWYEWDITDYVRRRRALGAPRVSVVLRVPVLTRARAGFAAREAGAVAPHLLVVAPSGLRATSPDRARP